MAARTQLLQEVVGLTEDTGVASLGHLKVPAPVTGLLRALGGSAGAEIASNGCHHTFVVVTNCGDALAGCQVH